MVESIEIWEKPAADEIYMIAGWRQWADGGSVSSGLPEYLIQRSQAKPIGRIRPDGFYLFQIPGTHGLVRPVVKFEQGYPASLETQQNDFFYAGDEQRGLIYFLGDEPHLDIERYAEAFLQAARELRVKRIIGLGGVYGELPYEKERMVSGIYSLPRLKEEMEGLAVNLSEYEGGVSIGSYICRRAGEKEMEYVAFYAFAPMYDFSNITQIGGTIRIENDYKAWLAVMKRLNFMLKLDFDYTDLEKKSQELMQIVDNKIDELDKSAPQLGIRDYIRKLSEDYNEMPFEPLDDVWEDEIRRLMDKFEDE
jgi:proteasome assembly chaperone (PAC2) family protein